MGIYALGSDEPQIHPTAFVHPEAVLIGKVTVGAESSIWPQAVLRGDTGQIEVGERTSIQDGTVVHATADDSTRIGNDCVVGHNAHLEGCTVLDGSLIGSGSVVLHAVTVGPGSLVAASALVPNRMEVPAGAIAVGVPAELRADAADKESILQGSKKYVELALMYRSKLRRLDTGMTR